MSLGQLEGFLGRELIIDSLSAVESLTSEMSLLAGMVIGINMENGEGMPLYIPGSDMEVQRHPARLS
jgi:hypothetical protein